MKTAIQRILRTPSLWGAGGILVFFLVSLSILPLSLSHLPSAEEPRSNLNPIQRENQLPGTRSWLLSNLAPYDTKTFHYPAIEGYAWTTSVEAGDEVAFSVSTLSPSFSADIYRMGWYQGKGGRLVQSIPAVPGHTYPVPSPEAGTGLIEANWPVAFTLKTNAHWISGMYMVKLTASNGKQSYIPFVLRSSGPTDFAFIHAVNTDEAYNPWGGTSLYADLTNTFKAGRAFKVSFDRPFEQGVGAGQFFWWEYPMVRWLEQHGYDVSYLSDLDLQNSPYSLQNYRVLLVVGHSEYWSKQMRDALIMATNKRVNLAVFAANTLYWQIRYASRSSGSQPLPERIIVCYKSKALDPLYGKENSLVTVQFRQDPLNSPENSLLGAMFGSWWQPTIKEGFPWVVADASSWVFAGTGLRNGDRLPGLVGPEFDKVYSNYPAGQGLEILAASPVVDWANNHDVANATLYTEPSGAKVFDAGTFQWAWGLDSDPSISRLGDPNNDSFGYTPRPGLVNRAAQQITANILQNFLRTGGVPQDISGYQYKKQITIDHTKVSGGANLSSFPVLISITDADLKTAGNGGYVQNSNGYDIIFMDITETTQLDHEIEKYMPSTGEIEMWVRIPTLSASVDTVIYMYYDNSSISSSQENKIAVWDTNYVSVWHMKETTGQHTDSTANGFNSSSLAVTMQGSAAGKVDGADSFNGTSDTVSAPDDSAYAPSTGTVEVWVKFNQLSSVKGTDQDVVDKTDSTNPFLSFVIRNDKANDRIAACFVNTSRVPFCVTSPNAVSAGMWYHIVAVKDGSEVRLYINGAQVASNTNWTGSILDSNGVFRVSGDVNPTNFTGGVIDEVRFSNIARSVGWIATEYNNQNSPATFYKVSSLMTVSNKTIPLPEPMEVVVVILICCSIVGLIVLLVKSSPKR